MARGGVREVQAVGWGEGRGEGDHLQVNDSGVRDEWAGGGVRYGGVGWFICRQALQVV